MLIICNHYPKTVWVSIMWYTPHCPDGGDWSKAGWWRIEPGQCRDVFHGDLHSVNQYFCYYAETADRDIWAGPYVRGVPQEPYDWCEWTANTNSRDVGFRLLDIQSYADFTLTLTPHEDFSFEKRFLLPAPLQQPSETATMDPVVCDIATMVCRHDGTWDLSAHFTNKTTDADCSLIFQFELVPNGSPPFGVTIDTDLSAAGDGRVTRIGLRMRGVPPEKTITRTGMFAAFRDRAYWDSVVVPAKGNYRMLAAWQTYPKTDPDDPDEGNG